MPGEHDRLVGVDALEEIVESLADIGIGGVDSLLGLGLVGQEGAGRCLAVFRRPDFVRPVEGARQPAKEYARAVVGCGIAKRGVPVAAGLDVAGGRNEEDCEFGQLLRIGGFARRRTGAFQWIAR